MMTTTLTGTCYVLGDNIDTDQIIPAEYLTYNPSVPAEYKMFGKFALAGVPKEAAGLPKGHQPFHTTDEFRSPHVFIVAGKNFGCGSSREHAPVALAAAGIQFVIAEFYARIFYRNCINGAYLVPVECKTRLIDAIRTGDELSIDLTSRTLVNNTTKETFDLEGLGEVAPIIEAGGVFEYAAKVGMLSK